MLRIGNISLPLDYDERELTAAVAAKLRMPRDTVLSAVIARRSVDARDKADVHFVITADASVRGEAACMKRLKPGLAAPAPREKPPVIPKAVFERRPVVVGAGPAGLCPDPGQGGCEPDPDRAGKIRR